MRKLGMLAVAMLILATGSKAQGVQGVHPDEGQVQVAAGFTFVNFHEVPNVTMNNVGFTASAVYRHNALGFEGEVTDTIASQNGTRTQLLFTGGGARYYMSQFASFRPWTEAEGGLAHLAPKSPYGNSNSLGYKVGAGFDFNPLRSRIEYRFSADMIGSSFFGTYQVSPEVSVALVLPIGR